MSTTSTYQGLNPDSKPSSRVLNPPGGGSSNIFGPGEQAPQRKIQNADNPNRGSNNIFSTSEPQQRGRAQPNGEDSVSVEGDKPVITSSAVSVNPSISSIFSNDSPTQTRCQRGAYQSPDTFNNVFGERDASPRNINPKFSVRKDDSFYRVFGEKSANEKELQSGVGGDSEITSTENSVSSDSSNSLVSSTGADESSSGKSIRAHREGSGHNSSFNRVFGEYMADSAPRKSARQTRVFNPITGLAFDQPAPPPSKPVPAEPAPVSVKAPAPAAPPPHTTTRVSQPPGGKSSKLW